MDAPVLLLLLLMLMLLLLFLILRRWIATEANNNYQMVRVVCHKSAK